MLPKGLKLVPLTAAMKGEFLAMAEEYRAAGKDRWKEAIDDFDAFLRTDEDYARGRNLPEDRVQMTTFWLVREGTTILGVVRLRPRLDGHLEHEGGHIGYDIRPSERRKGYGTLILGLVLEKARKLGLTRVLVTCDRDNVGSARIIQKNGGRLENEVISKRSGKPISRYWIDL